MILLRTDHPCLRVGHHRWYQSHYGYNTSRTVPFSKTTVRVRLDVHIRTIVVLTGGTEAWGTPGVSPIHRTPLLHSTAEFCHPAIEPSPRWAPVAKKLPDALTMDHRCSSRWPSWTSSPPSPTIIVPPQPLWPRWPAARAHRAGVVGRPGWNSWWAGPPRRFWPLGPRARVGRRLQALRLWAKRRPVSVPWFFQLLNCFIQLNFQKFV
jgi:hypothetical protein